MQALTKHEISAGSVPAKPQTDIWRRPPLHPVWWVRSGHGKNERQEYLLAGIRQYREDVLVNISVSYSCVDDAFVPVAKHRSYHIGLNVGIAVHDTT